MQIWTILQPCRSRTRTTILADLSADLSDTRAFPRDDPSHIFILFFTIAITGMSPV